jgi:putative membrane protein
MKTIKLMLMGTALILFSCHSKSNQKEHTLNKETMVLTNTLKDNDETFVKKAVSGGAMEIELGRYAAENAGNQRVKNFGTMMVHDHSQANDALKKLAVSKKYIVPDSMANEKLVNDLKSKKGNDFDKDYMKQMVTDHEQVIDDFKKEAENGRDEDLKEFVIKTLPVLQTHQDSAKNITNALK